MNYLAHILATYPHPEISLGNMAGDMIRNAQIPTLDPDVQVGVRVHRAIDTFTDQHSEIRGLVDVLRPVHGKYAPVAVDVILDYILSSDWEHHTGVPFTEFAEWSYRLIDEKGHLLPENVLKRLGSMRRHRWLEGYRTRAGLLGVLERMDRRANFPSQFAAGLKDLDQHYNDLKEGLREFYPDLIRYSDALIAEMQA